MICSVSEYRKVAKDWDTYDGNVEAELAKAQKLVEERTLRFYERYDAEGAEIERTELLPMRANGRVYPSALPLVSVSVPITAVIDGNALEVSAWALPDPWRRGAPPRVTVTYVGGYAPEEMPESLVHLVAEVAQFGLAPTLSLVPFGVTSIHVGDISMSGSRLTNAASLPSSVRAAIRTWRRKVT